MMMLPAGLLLATALLGQSSVTRGGSGSLLPPWPVGTGSWQGPLPPAAGWHPQFPGADDSRRASYVTSTGRVEIYINLYKNQVDGRELVNYANHLVAPSTWSEVWETRPQPVQAGDVSWSVTRLRGPDQRLWILTHGYVVDGHFYRTATAAKLAYGWFSLAGRAPAGILAAATVCEAGNCDNARTLVADFWKNMQLPLQTMLFPGTSP
jgi:EpsI family protein